MYKITTLLLFLIYSITSSANYGGSDVYFFGSIMTKTDTIKCYIEFTYSYAGKVKYKMNKEDKKSLKIDSEKIQKIKISTSVYDRINYGYGKSDLMKVLVSGEISLYRYTYVTSSSSAPNGSNDMGGSYSSSESEKLFLVKNDSAIKVKKRKIQETLHILMADNEKIQSEISEFKPKNFQFERKLSQLLSKYNFWYKFYREEK